MKLHFFTASIVMLAGASALAVEPPTRKGSTPSEEIRLLTPEEAGLAAKPKADQAAPGKRLPQPDNPLDPNRPRTSEKEPAKIKPAENAVTPAENNKKVQPKASKDKAKETDKPKDKAKDKPAKEPAKVRPAENAVTPAENTGKAKDKGGQDKQAALPPRRAVPLVVGTMPAAAPTATYGPRLETQSGGRVNPALPNLQPSRSAQPAGPVVVNSCDAGGCTDTNGVRYNGGVGNTVLSPSGRPCINNGVTLQC